MIPDRPMVERAPRPAHRSLAGLVAAITLFVAGQSLPSETGSFLGKVVVEVADEVEVAYRLRTVEDFGFRDSSGRLWLVPRGAIVNGGLLPEDIRTPLLILPEGKIRKAAVVRDYFVSEASQPWRSVARMFHAANVAEQVSEPEAALLYMAWYAGGTRWEPRGSSCYRSCHASAMTLAWRPDLRNVDLTPIAAAVWAENLSLDQIDARVDAAIRRPGPHLFGQQP
ncbi:MAG: DUF1353 domain-containing protein [Betaproteobacteria bacterium]